MPGSSVRPATGQAPDAADNAVVGHACDPVASPGLRRARDVGLAGSVMLAVGAMSAGALPVADASVPVLQDLAPLGPRTGLVAAYAGLTLLVLAWWRLGREVRERRVTVRRLVRVLLIWAAPLAVAPPLYSRDVYSYVAQGAMFRDGLDPYRYGPGSYGGVLAANVSAYWRDSPAPYGPLFLAVAAGVMLLAGGQVLLGVLGMRLVVLAAVAASVPLVVRLARNHGVDGAAAVWLGLLNPLVLAHFVSGAHNDALIVVLLLAGLLLAGARRPLSAALVIGAAVLLKASAVVALLFVVPAAARWLGGRRPLVRGAVAVGLVAAVTMTAITAAMDAWYGWVVALRDTARVRNGLSVTTDIGVVLGWALPGPDAGALVDPVTVTRSVGLAVTAVILPLIAARTVRRPAYGLGLALIAVVLLGPVVHPWYLLWGIVPLAAGAREPWLVRTAAVLSAGIAFYPMPSGGGPTPQSLVGVVGVLAGLAVGRLLLRGARPAPSRIILPPDQVDRPVPEPVPEPVPVAGSLWAAGSSADAVTRG